MGLIEDSALWAESVLALATGDPAAALTRLREIHHPVVVGFSSLDSIEAAYQAGDATAALAFGVALRRARRRADARVHLRAAFDGFEQLGATPWAERARAELRACGQTLRRRDEPGGARLTPQEVQVAQFVAQGLSNAEVAARLFLSRRTVDFHLRNVFAKLGISSRTELVRFVVDSAAS
jgi:DNA-binding NarL/FixJ family response regulator